MSLTQLSTVLRVMFIGSVRPDKTLASKVLGIRLQKVWNALKWLSSNNPLFTSTKISVTRALFRQRLGGLTIDSTIDFDNLSNEYVIPETIWNDACNEFIGSNVDTPYASAQNFTEGFPFILFLLTGHIACKPISFMLLQQIMYRKSIETRTWTPP